MKGVRGFIFTLLLLSVIFTWAQKRPQWTDGMFRESSVSYLEVVSGEGYDVANARSKALNQVVERRSLATGLEAEVVVEGNKQYRISTKRDILTIVHLFFLL